MFVRRWSTFSLVLASLGLGVIAYWWGRHAGSRAIREAPPAKMAESPSARDEKIVTPHPDIPDLSSDRGFGAQWADWQNQPRTPATERNAEQALQDLAHHDPVRAMALALNESNPMLRERLRNAVLKGWAAVAPDKAADWTLVLPAADRRSALVAVFSGAVERPSEAARLGKKLCAQIPEEAGDYGQLLISALTESGAYETAAHFAQESTSEHGPAWLNAAYYQWAMHQPESALKAFGGISDRAARSHAFLGLTAGWAEANPAAVANYAVNLPAGADRAAALGQMLSQWATRDPLTASEWMLKNLNPSPDLDEGVAAVASLPSLVSQRPEIAIGWAESIADPALRASTLTTVARLWAERDPDGARRYLQSTGSLSAEEKEALTRGLATGP